MELSGVLDEVDSSVVVLVIDVVDVLLVLTEEELVVESAVTVMRDRGTAVQRFPLSVVMGNPAGRFPLVDIMKYESACSSFERNSISLVTWTYIVRLPGHQNMKSIMVLTVVARNRSS